MNKKEYNLLSGKIRELHRQYMAGYSVKDCIEDLWESIDKLQQTQGK